MTCRATNGASTITSFSSTKATTSSANGWRASSPTGFARASRSASSPPTTTAGSSASNCSPAASTSRRPSAPEDSSSSTRAKRCRGSWSRRCRTGTSSRRPSAAPSRRWREAAAQRESGSMGRWWTSCGGTATLRPRSISRSSGTTWATAARSRCCARTGWGTSTRKRTARTSSTSAGRTPWWSRANLIRKATRTAHGSAKSSLQQRAKSLEFENAHRKELEVELRTALRDLRASEEALRRSEAELKDFFENAAEGLHWIGADGVVQWANKAELDMLGYSAEEYIGRPIAEFHADPEVIADILARLARNETRHDYEWRLAANDDAV